MDNKLLVYTGRQKTPMSFIKDKDLFYYPFTQMISRTNYKIDLFNFTKGSESIEELKALENKDLSFADCCLSRAEYLLALKRDRYYILYSGGIDSTGLVVSLLKVWTPEQLKKVTIVLTSHSILENPDFFEKTIKNFSLYNYMEGISRLFLEENSIIVTGELGDQLFGAGMLLFSYKKFGSEILKKNYKDFGKDVIEEYILHDSRRGAGHGQKLFDHVLPIATECPFEIRSVFDFFWWFNFSQEWQFAKYKFYESPDCPIEARYGKNIVHFYDSTDFQSWSLRHHDLKIKKTWESYKFTNKEFIYSFTKNAFNLKQLKLQSLKNTYFFQSFRVGINDNFEILSDYQELAKYVR